MEVMSMINLHTGKKGKCVRQQGDQAKLTKTRTALSAGSLESAVVRVIGEN